jgi:hypothetical protein
MKNISYTREVAVRHEVDVFIAGGGPAGIAAGVTAARQGARVFLAEGMACFGGMGTSAGLPLFCCVTDGVNFTSAGFGTDVYERLTAAGGAISSRGEQAPHMPPPVAEGAEPRPGIFDFSGYYNPEILKRVYDGLAEESGLGFSFHTQFLDVHCAHGAVEHVICAGKSGLFAVKAKVYIDCTGDGDLCARAGAAFEKGDARGDLQPATLVSLWGDVDWDEATASGYGVWQQNREFPRAFADKVFTVEDPHLPGMIPVGPHAGGGNIGHAFGIDGTDERSLTRGLLHGRKLLHEYERYYKNYLRGYARMQLLGSGALLGVRETRRILGDYVLNLEDFKRRAVFADEIGRFSYPVDLHAARPDKAAQEQFEQEFVKLRLAAGENYGIPYRCLLPRGLENVLVAGRCISTDRPLQGSVRVMPGCFITGQAAGMAAAMAAASSTVPRSLEVPQLQARLAWMGAWLPNWKAKGLAGGGQP